MNALAFDVGQDWSRSGFVDLGPILLAVLAVFALVAGLVAWLVWLDVRDRRRRDAAGERRHGRGDGPHAEA